MAKKQQLPQEKFTTAKFLPTKDGELRWVFIDQPGRENLQKKMVLQASIYIPTDHPGCKAFKDYLHEFWKANKPAGAPPKAKSYGWTDVVEKDEEGNDVYKDDKPVYTGETAFQFWTSAMWPAKPGEDPKPHIIDLYGTSGNSKISLGGKKIANGSKGAISGAMSIYDAGKGAQGVTLYLNAIQITLFIPYETDAGFGEEEGDFGGVEPDFEGTASNEEKADSEAKPRL